jgi:hypothetical protein
MRNQFGMHRRKWPQIIKLQSSSLSHFGLIITPSSCASCLGGILEFASVIWFIIGRYSFSIVKEKTTDANCGHFAVECKEKRKQIMRKSNFTLNGKLKNGDVLGFTAIVHLWSPQLIWGKHERDRRPFGAIARMWRRSSFDMFSLRRWLKDSGWVSGAKVRLNLQKNFQRWVAMICDRKSEGNARKCSKLKSRLESKSARTLILDLIILELLLVVWSFQSLLLRSSYDSQQSQSFPLQ